MSQYSSSAPSLEPNLGQFTDKCKSPIKKQSSAPSAVPSLEHYGHPIYITSYVPTIDLPTDPNVVPIIIQSHKPSSVPQLVSIGCTYNGII